MALAFLGPTISWRYDTGSRALSKSATKRIARKAALERWSSKKYRKSQVIAVQIVPISNRL
jgi:hypothetical protein